MGAPLRRVSGRRLAVLVPARDEGPRLGAVLDAVQRHLPEAALIVVDGGSVDHTADIARASGADLVRQRGVGYAGALRTGYARCVDLDVDAVIQLDGDGQHPPAAAPSLLEGLQHANWVVGSRAGTRSPGPLSRRLGNAALSAAVWVLAGRRLGDVTSGFWAFDRRTLSAFLQHFPADVADANLRVLASRLELTLAERPVEMVARSGGRSMHDGPLALRNFSRSLRAVVRESRRPL